MIFLKDSSLNSIPFEIVKCLNNAMGDWVDSKDFIIVTGLTKDLYAFSFFLDYTRDDFFYQSIKIKYGVEFDKKLVQINLPITLSKDYISTVPLYHELGHFVEKQFDIGQYVLSHLIDSGKFLELDIQHYFSFVETDFLLKASSNRDLVIKFYNHIMEYFCDLFAAQYIGLTSNVYLNSISNKSVSDSLTHPSSVNREEMVHDFLFGKSNTLIDSFNYVLGKIANKKLQMRFEEIDSGDFYRLIPFTAVNDAQLHGIFNYGWRIWLGDFSPFSKMLGDTRDIPGAEYYKIVNNLMEKSIGNYFILKDWNSNK